MLLGLAALVIALWELPNFRRAVFSDYYNIMFSFIATAVLGGWVGYWIFATLFINK